MTIRAVRCHRIRAALHTPWVTAVRRTESVESVLVELIDQDGRSGWGEGVATPTITGETLGGIEAAVGGPLRDAVLGRDPDDLAATARSIAASMVGNTAAKAAADVALHDLAARRSGVSLARLLGTTVTTIPTDATITVGPADAMAAAARARGAEGFAALKVKLGNGEADDVARLRAVRAAAPDALIRVDANQGWTPKQAVRIIGTIEDLALAIELVEQPVAADDIDGLAYVTAHSGTPIMADEAVSSAADVVEIIRRRAADLVNIKLAKAGGLAPAVQIAAVAAAAGIGTMVGSMMESHVGVGAAAALTAAVGAPLLADLDAAWWLRSSPVTGGMTYAGPTIVLPAGEGSGVAGLADPAAP
ncbi:MAG: enolase C-terminal domain-like protein [Mycobacteriales bacterium]